MKPPFDFTNHFKGRSMTSAVWLCGSTIGAMLIGLDISSITALVDMGLSHVMPHVPFMETGTAINSYFSGIQSWVGGVAMGLFDWGKDVGSDAVQAVSHSIVEIRNALGPRAGALREFFTETLRGGMDAGAVFLSSVRDSISRDPAGAASFVGDALTKAVEAFGVAKGLQEAYKYAKAKVFGKTKDTPPAPANGGSLEEATDPAAARNVTNIHLNIALGNTRDVGEAVDELVRSVQHSANPELLTEHLIKTLAPHAPLTADSPVAASDIRAPKAKPASSDDIFNLLDDSGPNTIRFDLEDDADSIPLIRGEDVVWCAESFQRGLEEGVRRSMGGKLNPEQLHDAIEGLSRSRKPMASIEGGIILRATPRGELVTSPVTPRTNYGSGLLIQ